MLQEKSNRKKYLFFKILWIILIIGWVGFMVYNFYLWLYIVKQYDSNPSNFVFFESEYLREQYKLSDDGVQYPAWVDDVSLVADCRPMIYLKDFFFDKVRPFIYYIFLLIILTLIYRLDPREVEKIKEVIDRIDQEDNK